MDITKLTSIRILFSRYLCGRLNGLIEELSRLIHMSDEITLDEDEKRSVRVLYRDLIESLPCLCEVRTLLCTYIGAYNAIVKTLKMQRNPKRCNKMNHEW